jgi:pimeloyl-ACP methyl ester carboxylesterase
VITLVAADGTPLAAHRSGPGRPLVCLPGGPLKASDYLGDLGGLAAPLPLVRLDLRGTGASGTPDDPISYRWDRQVGDVEVLREHLGLDRLDLLAHSAGAAIALGYATAHPARVRRLVLITPSPRAVGLPVSDADRRAVADSRQVEPWFPAASAALHRIADGSATAEDWAAITPLTYGRWDDAARAHAAAQAEQPNPAGAAEYYGATTAPDDLRAGLGELDAPVLVVAGECDVVLPPTVATRYAELFPRADLVMLPGAGHFPWLDDPRRLAAAVQEFVV